MPSGCDANALFSASVQQSRQHFCIALSRNTSLFGSLFRVMANACQVLGHLMLSYGRTKVLSAFGRAFMMIGHP